VPGALSEIRLPVRTGSCARRVAGSIGRPPDPAGPRWLGATLVEGTTVITIDEGYGRVTATVASRLSDTGRTWIEDDVIYLRDTGDRWRILKPSAVLHRAVGYVEIPLDAITPP